jgi:hypothetical protein
MAVYLLNLGFSMNPASSTYLDGNFEPNDSSQPGLSQSCAWLEFTGKGISPVLDDKPSFVPGPLVASDWTLLGDDDQFPLTATAGDFILVRVFPTDVPYPVDCKVRISAVFGRGSGNAHDHINDRQSPLQMDHGNWKTARAVVDSDDTSYLTWKASDGDDPVWVYCLGMLYNPPGKVRTYSMSVGASVYRPSSDPLTPTIGIYGHDPDVHVKGGGPIDQIVAA